MSIETFRRALMHDSPPAGWSRALQALWYQGKGDWERAHALAQDVDAADGFWVHAHLHRTEGERVNAGYWYRCAGRTPSAAPIAQEFEEIATTLLQR
jgi:hypothetical protein